MASIHSHGTGFRVHHAGGKSPTFPTREGAEAWMRDSLPALSATHIFDIIDLWKKEEPSPYRIEAATRLEVAARKRGWGDVRRLDLATLRAWQRAHPSPRYAQYLLTVLRWAASVHKLPVRSDALTWRPGSYTRKPPIPLLTDQQVEAIRDCALMLGHRAFAVVDYLLTYGARPITASRIRLAHLDQERGELVIADAKHSGGWRHALLGRHLSAWPVLTQDWLVGPAMPDIATIPLFPHWREDRPWKIVRGSARELADWYKATIGKRLKLGAQNGIYNLKRYAITSMLRKGVDPATVALFTGHLDVQQVLTYAKSNHDLQQGALDAIEPDSQAHSQIPKMRAVTPLTP